MLGGRAEGPDWKVLDKLLQNHGPGFGIGNSIAVEAKIHRRPKDKHLCARQIWVFGSGGCGGGAGGAGAAMSTLRVRGEVGSVAGPAAPAVGVASCRAQDHDVGHLRGARCR